MDGWMDGGLDGGRDGGMDGGRKHGSGAVKTGGGLNYDVLI